MKIRSWTLYNESGFGKNKIFLANAIPGLKKNFLYQEYEPNQFKPKIQIISRIRLAESYADSDFVLVPHPWIAIKKNHHYLDYLKNIANKVPLIIANSDDVSPKCNLPNTIELRSFLHPKEDSFRKIIFPYPAKKVEFITRTWTTIPTVSFMGFVPRLGLGSLTSKSRSFVKSPINSSVYLNRKISVFKLQKMSDQIKVICVPRPSFTLLSDNINLHLHTEEYKKNLQESDYIVCPRGFGNTSIRFYESLSSGATPILIKSGSQLPEISNSFWNTNILQVNLFSNWENLILDDWSNLRYKNNYYERQLANSQFFNQELYFEKFALNVFSNYIL